mgnify:FL=1
MALPIYLVNNMLNFIAKKKRESHKNKQIKLDRFLFLYFAGGLATAPIVYNILMYQVGIINTWGDGAGLINIPSRDMWWATVGLLLFWYYRASLLSVSLSTRSVIYCYDNNGTPTLRRIFKYPLIFLHILVVAISCVIHYAVI